jgi:hypothetical protein
MKLANFGITFVAKLPPHGLSPEDQDPTFPLLKEPLRPPYNETVSHQDQLPTRGNRNGGILKRIAT